MQAGDIDVSYMDHMGSDASVVDAARVSFAKRAAAFTDDQNRALVQYLARGMTSRDEAALIRRLLDVTTVEDAAAIVREARNTATHWSPFAHTAVTLRVKAPIPVRTQLFRHKVGLAENEESRRYITETPDLYVPDTFRRAPGADRKQGSGGPHASSDQWVERYRWMCTSAIIAYEAMIHDGVAPEQARFVLPQGVMVQWVWTGNVASFARIVMQRRTPHAQAETRMVTERIAGIVAGLFPWSWEALTG